MVKKSGLLESFFECQTALQQFKLPQDSSKSSLLQFQEPSPTVGWVVAIVSEEHTMLSAGYSRSKAFSPVYGRGRWFYQAELVHYPSSISTNGPVLSLGKSISNPQKGCISNCLKSSTAIWESIPSLIN